MKALVTFLLPLVTAFVPQISVNHFTRCRPPRLSSTAQVEAEENPRLSGLALMLDDGTRKSHSMAENTQFVTGFFKGLGDRASFSQLVTSLYFIYKAMEEAFEATA